MFVLDTNSLIYFFNGQGHVGERILEIPPSEIGVPAIVLYELEPPENTLVWPVSWGWATSST